MKHELVNLKDQTWQQWVFRHNCSLTPKQLVAWFISLWIVSTLIATGFLMAGLWVVIPFAGLEMLLVATAFLYYARHAADFDCVRISPGHLVVERSRGSKQERFEFNPAWTRIEFEGEYKSPLVLKSRAVEIKLDRFIEDRLKHSLVRDLKLAIARAAS